MSVDIVFFGAHPDDVEWGVGGTALLLSGKLSFVIADLTDGEMGSRGTPDQRKVEAAAAAEYLGAAGRESLHLPDAALVDSPDNRRRIAAIVRRFRPNLVLAPYWHDRHPDHAAAGLMVRNSPLYCALKNSPDPNPPHKPAAFLFYPVNHSQRPPSFVVNTSDVFERKLDLMRIHRSQFSKTAQEFGVIAHGMNDYMFSLETRDRNAGSLIGARFGEALIAERPVALSSLGDLLRLG